MGGPAPLSYSSWLLATADHDPGRLALIDPTGSLTYGQLAEGIRSVAGGIARAGLRPGEPVALACEPSASYLVLFLGALQAGVVPAFVNTRLTPREVTAFLDRIRPQAVVCDRPHGELVAGFEGPCVEVPGLAGTSLREQLEPLYDVPRDLPSVAESDPAVIFPTGGTTGLPKGCYTSHRGLQLWSWNVAASTLRHRNEVELYFAPFFHVSLVVGLLAPLFAGGTVVIEPTFTPSSSLEAIRRHGVTRLMGAPTVFTALMQEAGGDPRSLHGIRDIVFGSTSWTDAFCRSLLDGFPNAAISCGYGATEFASGVSRIAPADFAAGRWDGAGRPNPGCRMKILDPDDKPVAAGESGQIAVRSPWQTLGYWNQPDETAATYGADGYIRLGDVGRFDETGWLHVSGRLKEMIITGGENVFPVEVEQALNELPGVVQAVAFGLPDDYWGERVEAAVTVRPGEGVTVDALRASVRESLAGYKVPKRIHVVDALPLTPNNKPDRRALQERFADG
jgi:acyl-CoA synthetase (AMP-forming)/AMP-acid ligase II